MTKHLFTLIFAITFVFSIHAQDWEARNESPFRSHHSIAFSLNGIGYSVTGNVQGDPTAQFYSYDPTADSWTQKEDYPGPRRDFGIGDTWDGKAYIGFGANEDDFYLRDLWVYDPIWDTWTELASCPCTGRLHPAFVAQGGKIFMGMGNGSNGNINDWWEYDIATNVWKQRPSFPAAVRHHPYQFAIGDFVYAGLGHGNSIDGNLSIYNDWYRYDPQNQQWDQMADLPAEGRVAGTQFSNNGKGYVLSGDGDDHSYMPTGEFWEYDPILNEWTELPPHPGFSRWAPSSFVIDDYVYFMNGLSQSLVEDLLVWRYLLEDTPATSNNEIVKNEIKISPNPAVDIINIEWKESPSTIVDISMFDSNGQLIFNKTPINSNSFTLNIQHIPSGLYYLKIELPGEVISKKIIKL